MLFVRFCVCNGFQCLLYKTEFCNFGKAYNAGTMVNDNAPANNAADCWNQCNILSNCKFWDFGDNICRLRSNDGGGPKLANSFAYGQKNCQRKSKVCRT